MSFPLPSSIRDSSGASLRRRSRSLCSRSLCSGLADNSSLFSLCLGETTSSRRPGDYLLCALLHSGLRDVCFARSPSPPLPSPSTYNQVLREDLQRHSPSSPPSSSRHAPTLFRSAGPTISSERAVWRPSPVSPQYRCQFNVQSSTFSQSYGSQSGITPTGLAWVLAPHVPRPSGSDMQEFASSDRGPLRRRRGCCSCRGAATSWPRSSLRYEGLAQLISVLIGCRAEGLQGEFWQQEGYRARARSEWVSLRLSDLALNQTLDGIWAQRTSRPSPIDPPWIRAAFTSLPGVPAVGCEEASSFASMTAI